MAKKITHPAQCGDCRYYRGWHYCPKHTPKKGKS